MKPDAKSATAADFDAAAHRNANGFWVWGAVTAIVAFFLGWWALIPAALASWSAASSLGATRAAGQLRSGTFPVLNFNNGAPDGDINNLGAPEKISEHKTLQLERSVKKYVS